MRISEHRPFRSASVLRTLGVFAGLLLAGSFAGPALGQELDWARRAGGTERDSWSDIAVDTHGNSYVTGLFRGSASFGFGEPNQTTLTSTDDADIFVAKYDSAGALVWAKRAGGPDHELVYGIAVDGVGNSYVTGRFSSAVTFGPGEAGETVLTSAGGYDVFVAKYDSSGNLVWTTRPVGGMEDEAYDIAVDEAGNTYVTGLFGYWDYGSGSAIFGLGEPNQTVLTDGGMFIAKYDSAGALAWAKRGFGTNGHSFGIAVDPAGNSYVTGEFSGTTTFGSGEVNQTTLTSEDNVVFVAKYDSAGALLWVKQAGDYALGLGITVDGAGNSYVTGIFGGTGGFRGTATFGVGEANQTVLNSAGNGDMFVAKYDSDGALLWARRAGGTEGDGASGIAVDGAGNSYVVGAFGGAATFGPEEPNQTTLFSAGQSDMFVAKYDSAGMLLWATRSGGPEGDSGDGIAMDGARNVYVTGSFSGTALFGTEAIQVLVTSAGSEDVFVVKYSAPPLPPPQLPQGAMSR